MTADEYMEKAARALTSARLLLDDNDVEGACNRAYYAMFDAAHGALLRSGALVNPAETKTHSGLIGAFGCHLVKTGRLPAELGRALNEVERVRLLADYTGDRIDHEKANWAVDQSAAFIVAIQQEITSRQSESPPNPDAESA
jgi:uncharacterized protein (UPF0332 family)